ncbi:MAG: amidohydrolase family protein [Schumannella sp.]
MAIRGRDIVAIRDDAELSRRFAADHEIDAAGAPVHPGRVETHVHPAYHLYRGIFADDVPEDEVFPGFTRAYLDTVTEEEEFLAVQLAAIEMVRNGTTCFVEAGSVFAPDAAARAATGVGIRAVLADAFLMDQPDGFIWDMRAGSTVSTARASREPQDLDQALQVAGGQLWRNADPDALVTGHIALRGLGTASPELIGHCHELAVRHGAILNMHHAYEESDHEAVSWMFGTDPVLGLEALGVLDESLLLSHANVLSDRETDALLTTGAGLSWAPAASMIWGHSVVLSSRHARFWRAGGSVGLGSDSSNWSNVFDLFRQAQLAILLSRTIEGDRAALGAVDALRIATIGGARAAGLGDRIGSLEPGKRADLVIHSADRPESAPAFDPVRNLVYAAGSRTVRSVVIDGRVVLRDGRLTGVDEPEALAAVETAARAMVARTGYLPRRDGMLRA